MKELPRFYVEEGWDNKSILIQWHDNIPHEAREVIDVCLKNVKEFSAYHADCIVTKALNFLVDNKYLMKSPITKTWIMRRGIKNDYYTCERNWMQYSGGNIRR
jgi:hypothetical protein